MYRYSLGRKVNSESCAKTVQNDSYRQLNENNSYKAEQQRRALPCAHHHHHHHHHRDNSVMLIKHLVSN